MKNKVIKGVLLFYVMLLVIACHTKKAEPVVIDKEQIKKEIQAREDEFAALYNTGELKSIGYYADDAITFSQNRAPLVGREARVEYLKADIILKYPTKFHSKLTKFSYQMTETW